MPIEVAQQSGLEAWINQYGNIIYFFGQLAFWLALAVAAVYAVVLFKRLVDHQTGAAAAKAAEKAAGDSAQAGKPKADEPVKIDEFVE
jgi:Ca2+/H+ antiporter